ncbi:MAG: ECF transporter S component [Oscillospiraceae bacterium]|jgi:uncharacterized membrane protein|nr:ECF transporter S component [Oscillospiraceae bacterium]
MKKINVRNLSIGSLFAAIICVATAVLKIPVGITNGYVHLGDMFIFAASAALGPYAALSAGIGSGLADLFAGYPVYILPTLIIKGSMGFIAGKSMRKLPGESTGGQAQQLLKIIVLFTICELFMCVGYWAFETVLYGVAAATAALPMNLLQGLFGVIGGTAMVRLIPKRLLEDK